MASHPVIELVKAYERFEQEHPKGDLEAFCRDFLRRSHPVRADERRAAPVSPADETRSQPEESLGMYIGRLYKFTLFYARKAMTDMPLDNVEDFGFLATLHFGGEMRKSELIQHNLTEFTTGTNVISRLLRKGIIDELPDPTDARSKRVRINAAGEALLGECLPPMWHIEHLLFGMLSEEEKGQARDVLRKVERFHTARFAGLRTASREEILRRLGTSEAGSALV